ncbi:MAG: SDR family NAD(P)-dependent oxidoreductase, partial [Acidimicrobiales bacterium]|nr:SDR family NAD(P)-dependent oxidoreductase [Acidimicrobiales bacterium]
LEVVVRGDRIHDDHDDVDETGRSLGAEMTPSSPPSVAVVTGASRGLGAGLARTFSAAGVRLGLCARHLPEAPTGAEVLREIVDVADSRALDTFAAHVVDRFGRIDLWVNNAGVLEPVGALSQVDADDLRRHIEINVCGVLYGTATFARHVRSRPGGGVLVNISSGASTTPYQGWAAYSASKAAVAMASEVTARDEAGFGLRVFALSPGVVDTDMQAEVRTFPTSLVPASDRFRRIHREGAFNTPEWVGRYILEQCWPGRAPTGSEEGEPVRVRVPDEHPG